MTFDQWLTQHARVNDNNQYSPTVVAKRLLLRHSGVAREDFCFPGTRAELSELIRQLGPDLDRRTADWLWGEYRACAKRAQNKLSRGT